MNLGSITTRVTARLNEAASGPVFYPLDEQIAAVNEGERLFCLLSLALETTLPWTVPANTTWTHMLGVFPDWIVPLRLSTVTGAKVRPSRLEELGALDSGWLNSPINSPGLATRYVALGADLVGLYGQPDYSGLVLNWTYARAPVPLVNPDDVPEIPAEYHPRLIEYGIYRLRQVESGQELEKALTCFNSFLDGAKRYAAYVRSRNLGARYDHVPPEDEFFDRSKLLRLRPDLVPDRKITPVG